MAAQLGNLMHLPFFKKQSYVPYYFNVNFASKIHKPDYFFILTT